MTAETVENSVTESVPRRARRRFALRAGFLPRVSSFVVAAVLWEAVARIINKPIILVPLSTVCVRLVQLWRSGDLETNIWVSFVEFASGFGLSIVFGILGGMIMAGSARLRAFFEPWVTLLYSTPIIALGPLFILWLGIGVWSKIWIVFLTAVFPILINTLVGLTTTDRTLIDVARSFGATKHQINMKVRLPSALPFIIAGLRISVARGLVGVVVAELFGARAGLGFMILTSAQTFDTAALFGGVILLAAAGVVAVEALKWLEWRISPWRFEEGTE